MVEDIKSLTGPNNGGYMKDYGVYIRRRKMRGIGRYPMGPTISQIIP